MSNLDALVAGSVVFAESIAIAESLVALSSKPLPIPSKKAASKKEPLNNLMEDCSPTGVEDVWKFPRPRLASESSDSSISSATSSMRRAVEADENMDDLKFIGSYTPEERRKRIERFLEKRKRRVWTKKVDYNVRKNFADSRLRVKGRFVKKEDEELLCDMLSFT